MTPADDLRPGMWVAIVGREEPEEEPENPWALMAWPTTKKTKTTRTFTGEPFQILAISLPFLCVIGSGKQFAVDIRSVDVQRLNRQFVRAMLAKPPKTKETEKLEACQGPFGIPQWVYTK